jgi:flagellar motor switch protein FliG
MKQLTHEEKVALFLRSLAPDVMDTVLAKLAPDRRTRLRSLIQRSPEADPRETLDQVLREIETLLPQPGTSHRAPVAAAQVASAYGVSPPPKATEPDSPVADPVAALTRLEPEHLASALQGENPRTVFLVLNQLPVEQAGQLFKRLPGDLRREVSVQFSSPVMPGQEVLQRIAQAVVRKSRLLQETPPEPGPEVRFRKMATLVRLLEREDRKDVLAALEERDPACAAVVKGQLYQFEDLLKIEKRSMQKLLADLDTKNLALALKGADAAITEKVLSNMSQRAQDNLKEEMEFSGTPAAAQIEQARKIIVDSIQHLDEVGDLTMMPE